MSRDRISNEKRSEKWINDLETKEKKLSEEIELLKSERDRKLVEFQGVLDKEKEGYKVKLADLDKKLKECE